MKVIDIGIGHYVSISDVLFTNGIAVFKDTPADETKLNTALAFLQSTGMAYEQVAYNPADPRHVGKSAVAQNVVTGIMDTSGVGVTKSALPSTGNSVIDGIYSEEPKASQEPQTDPFNLGI